MLVISDAVADSFHAQGLRALRQRILTGWQQRLRTAGDTVGEAGRNDVLAQVEELSREDPSLTVADLTMLADLMLVGAANEARAAAGQR